MHGRLAAAWRVHSPHDMSADPTGVLAWLALAAAYAVAVRAVRREPTDLRASDEPALRLVQRPARVASSLPLGAGEATRP